jgi:hypothetical protein
MNKMRLVLVALAVAVSVGACSKGATVGGLGGAAGGYALDGKRGAVLGGLGGAAIGSVVD